MTEEKTIGISEMEKNPIKVLCCVCKQPIKVEDWAGVGKGGYYHKTCYEDKTCYKAVVKAQKERDKIKEIIDRENITCGEDLYQRDVLNEKLPELMEEICEIVGFCGGD